MIEQNQLFHREALGNYKQLIAALIHDPAMLRYLDADKNVVEVAEHRGVVEVGGIVPRPGVGGDREAGGGNEQEDGEMADYWGAKGFRGHGWAPSGNGTPLQRRTGDFVCERHGGSDFGDGRANRRGKLDGGGGA